MKLMRIGVLAAFAVLSGCPPAKQATAQADASTAQPTKAAPQTAAAKPAPDVPDEVVRDVASDLSRLGIRLYRAQAESDRGNLAISPASISAAFALAYPGARNETARVMERVFGFSPPAVDVLAAHSAVLAGGEGCVLDSAAGAFVDKGLELRAEYRKMLVDSGAAEVQQVGFDRPDVARDTINRWVDAKTRSMIPEVIPERGLQPRPFTRMVLTSALYFNGAWLRPFEPSDTEDDDFRTESGSRTVPFMSRSGSYRFAALKAAEVVELPYRCGNWSMLFLLPWDGLSAVREVSAATGLGLGGHGVDRVRRPPPPKRPTLTPLDALARLERALSRDLLAEIDQQLEHHSLHLRVPRFELTATLPLTRLLHDSLGAAPLFKPSADFSGITNEREFFLKDAFHLARVRVNEEGTEAAAGTALILGGRGGGGEPPVFSLDRPFLFAIRDRTTGAILFLGRVIDPG